MQPRIKKWFLINGNRNTSNKIDLGKLNFIKIKAFCDSKYTIKKMKKKPTEWNKLFVNHIPNKTGFQNIKRTLATQS